MAVMLLRIDVGPLTWCRCWLEVCRVGYRYWRSLAKDVVVAARMAMMGKSRRLARYQRAAGSAMAEPQPNRSVLVVAGDLVEESDRAVVCAEVERLIGAGHMATVLVSQVAADRFVDALDALRVAGVPVQICRSPTGFERRTGPLGEFAVTVAAVVDSGADSIHVLPGSEHLLSHLGIARKCLLRGISVEEVNAHRDGDRGTSPTRALA
jgi:hypothetical protein